MSRSMPFLNPWTLKTSRSFNLSGWKSEDRGRPLIHFMPGNGLCSRVYDPFLHYMSDNFDFFMQDMQGHGKSEAGPKFVGWEASADLALEVIDQHQHFFKNRPVIGMGHSFGAIMTLLMAAKRPELFSGLILLDPVLFPLRYLTGIQVCNILGISNFLPMPRHAKRRRSTWSSGEAAWDYLCDKGIFKTWHKDSLDSYVRHALKKENSGNVRLCCPPELEAAIFASCPIGLWKAVRKIKVPSRIYFGANTYHWIPASVQHACDLNPMITYRKIKSGGHCFMLEKPKSAFESVIPGLTEFSRHESRPANRAM